MVYLAESVSLAAIEMVAHFDERAITESYTIFAVSFSTEDCLSAPHVPRSSEKRFGDEWARSKSLALRVPSAVVPEEWNYLINPRLISKENFSINEERTYAFDQRLFIGR